MKKSKKQTLYIVMLLIVVILCFLSSVFFIQFLLIQGDSMEPTFRSGQLVLLNKAVSDYSIGDCILFYSEGLECNLIKRVVALPGDIILISNGKLFIDGEPCLPYDGCPEIQFPGLAAQELTIPDSCFFVLGDNFANSIDSRHEEVSFVKFENIKGKIIA